MKRLLTYLAINAAFMLLMAPAAMADRVPELDAMSNEELITSASMHRLCATLSRRRLRSSSTAHISPQTDAT